ncbi:MAG TPA: hypothetical protein VLA78_01960 [Paracoccaceae bacterium]|jgi:hypothetical protein|nr:hypothetical protein [Paracoccaceae bacterium]
MPKARPDRIPPARQRGKADGARAAGTAQHRPRVLAIDGGETLTLLERCRKPPALVLAHGRDLDGPLIARVAPRAVVFALFAEQNDALAILGRLAKAGHTGRIFALSPPLPNPRMVERELKARFPALRLRILQILPPPD